MDTSKDLVEESVTTDSVITPSGGVTMLGVLNSTASLAAAEAVSVYASCICMHGTNKTHPDCSFLCTNGTLGSRRPTQAVWVFMLVILNYRLRCL